MKKLTIEQAALWLRGNDHFVLVTHRRPDGDTVGCAASLCRGLRKLGKNASVLENPQITPRYAPYLAGLTVETVAEDATVVTVDVAGTEMLPQNWKERPIDLLIDHHGTNRGFAGQGYNDPASAACGEIIYELLTALGVELDRDIANALYVAVCTDTGCFRYSNTTGHTLRTAAACLEAGADFYRINKEVYGTISLGRHRLNAYMTEHLRLYADGKIALVFIPWELEQELGLGEDDLEDVSSFGRSVAGVHLAVTFRTIKDGSTKLSVRCAPEYDAAALCACFGGGGHRAAAGATIRENQEKAGEMVLDALKKLGLI